MSVTPRRMMFNSVFVVNKAHKVRLWIRPSIFKCGWIGWGYDSCSNNFDIILSEAISTSLHNVLNNNNDSNMTAVPWEWLSELWQRTEGGVNPVNLHIRTPPPCVSAQHVPFCRPAPLLLLLHCLTSAVDLPLKCRSIRFPNPPGMWGCF